MSIHKLFLLILLILVANFCNGQTDLKENRYLSIGTKTFGLCLGNSNRYSGIRLNLWDKYYKNINGFNFAFNTVGGSSNGLQIGGLFSNVEVINGISVSGFASSGRKINGIGVSGFFLHCDTLRGLFVSPFISSTETEIKIINGVAIGLWVVRAEKINGVTLVIFSCYSQEFQGLSIAVSNKTENLHGVQIGLMNYAGNNPKLLRRLPLLNFHP